MRLLWRMTLSAGERLAGCVSDRFITCEELYIPLSVNLGEEVVGVRVLSSLEKCVMQLDDNGLQLLLPLLRGQIVHLINNVCVRGVSWCSG